MRLEFILLAEDKELNYEIANELLTEMGMIVDWAENGKICVDMFQQSSLNYYDAVLMDIRMPEMNGLDATKSIRALDRKDAKIVPIIAISADSFDSDKQNCFDAGMDAHTSKPMDVMQVLTLLEHYIKAKRG